MLEKLSADQEKLMNDVKNEYIHLLERKTNDNDAIEGVKFAYKIAGLREPEVKIFDSPLSCQLYLNTLQRVPLQVTKRIEQQIRREIQKNGSWPQGVSQKVIHDVHVTVGLEVNRQLDLLVRRPVFPQVDLKVKDEVERQVGRQRAIYYFLTEIDAMLLSGQLPICDYYERIGIAKNDLPSEYKKYFRSGIFSSTYFDSLALVSRNPLRLSRNDRGRLHNQEWYAIEWADGYGQNFVHGVFFEPELFDKIFIKKNITGKEILGLRNIEQKAVAIQSFGYDKLMDELNAKKIDTYRVKNAYTGIESVSELYDFEIEHNEGDIRRVIRGRFVKVQDHSTGKITVLGVPVSRETDTVKGAIAWSFGLNENEYNIIVES